MVHPLQRTGRLAGFLYLLVALSGPFVLLYVPGRLLAGGNPATTAANILAHESLYRAYIVVGILAELAFVSVALVLYRLLQGVNANLAAPPAPGRTGFKLDDTVPGGHPSYRTASP